MVAVKPILLFFNQFRILARGPVLTFGLFSWSSHFYSPTTIHSAYSYWSLLT